MAAFGGAETLAIGAEASSSRTVSAWSGVETRADVEAALRNLSSHPGDSRLRTNADVIDRAFAFNGVEEILAALAREDGEFRHHETDGIHLSAFRLQPVKDHLAYRFDLGRPCGCGVCEAGGDCCGRWFTTGVMVWQAGEPGLYYVRVGRAMNV